MPSIFVERTSRDYPAIINTRNICCARCKECEGDRLTKAVRVSTVDGDYIEYGRYTSEEEAYMTLDRIGKLIELGE